VNPFDFTGPQFLVFYIIFAGAVLGGLVVWRRRSESSEAPKLDLSDPYLIAYLRGGSSEVLRVATVALLNRKLLIRNGKQLQRAEHASPNNVHRPVEQALLKKYARAGEATWMFEDDGLKTACRQYERTLKKAQMLPDESVNQARLMRLVIAGFLLTGVGLTRILFALFEGRTNVGFLIILMIVSIVVAVKFSFPRLTESGKATLEDVQSLYSGLRNRTAFSNTGGVAQAGAADGEPMMLAAAFGVGALAGPALADANDLFHRKKDASSSGGGDGGCGSSCGSSDGGGSSCGSSCGGGCGGCGG
jgi:uncharacterized protein (TIGR04222 family)